MNRVIFQISLFCVAAALAGCASQEGNVKKLRVGYDALNAHQFDAAQAAADEVLASGPKETLPAEAHYLRGRAYEGRAMVSAAGVAANLQNARTEYIAAVGLPMTPYIEGRVRASLANVAFHQDDYATALEQWTVAYEKLDKLEDKVYTLYQLGRASQRLGRWEEADRDFAGVLEVAAGSDLAGTVQKMRGARGFTVQLADSSDGRQVDVAVADLRKQGIIAQHLLDPANRSRHLLCVGPIPRYLEAKTLKARFAGVYPKAVVTP